MIRASAEKPQLDFSVHFDTVPAYEFLQTDRQTDRNRVIAHNALACRRAG